MADLPYIQQAQEVKITGQGTTGTTVNYVSADSTGHLFTLDSSDGTSGSVVPTTTLQIGGSDGTDLRTLATSTIGHLKVDLNDGIGDSLSSTFINGRQALDVNDFSADTTVDINITAVNTGAFNFCQAKGTSVVTISGTWVATLTFQGFEGVNWITIPASLISTGVSSTSTTTNGSFKIDTAGFQQVRVFATAFTSGTANVVINSSASQDMPIVESTNSQLKARDIIDISSQYRAQSITTTAAEALGAATILLNRKFLSITPTNGTVYWGTNSSVTTATGTPIFANTTLFLSFSDNVHVFVISAATTDCRMLEGS